MPERHSMLPTSLNSMEELSTLSSQDRLPVMQELLQVKQPHYLLETFPSELKSGHLRSILSNVVPSRMSELLKTQRPEEREDSLMLSLNLTLRQLRQ